MRPFRFVREENEDFKIQPEQSAQPEEPVQDEQQQEPSQEPGASTDNVTDQTPEVIDGEKASNFSASIIISAMPLLGKSTYCREKEHNSLDLESSTYSRNQDGSRNEEFPGNYVNVLKWHLVNMNWKYIFVACHEIFRNAMKEDKIKFITLYPAKERKEELLQLARERGNHEDFIKALDENWDAWISKLEQEPDAYKLDPNEFISDELFKTKLKFLMR